jgi:hypothetical protein
MKTTSNEHDKDEKPVKSGDNAQGMTYEQCIAYHIVGRPVLDGALDARNFNFEKGNETGLPFVVEQIAEALLEGLAAYGWQYSISEIINAAQIGELHGWKPKQTAEKGGAE